MNRLPIILLATAGFAHAFVLWLHINRMLGTEHYSFFPLGLIAVGVLWIQRRDEIAANASKSSPIVGSVLLSTSIVTSILASLLTSGFFGWISTVIFFVAFAYTFFGFAGLTKAIPVLVMLAVITPLPALLDRKLILNMQYMASTLASRGLDVFGVIHVRQGVVIVATSQSFLAEEACSGIRSLFSTIAGIIFWGLFHRYSILRHLLNLAQAIFWVIVFNAARIMCVVLVEEWTDFSIASGWKHDAFGFIIFFFIGGIVLSTDRLFRAFVPPKASEKEEAKPSRKKLNDWDFPGVSMPEPKWIYPFAGAFALVGLLGLRLWSIVPAEISLTSSLPAVEEAALPKSIGNWNVVSFRQAKRSRGDLQGEKSYIWELESNQRRVTVSVDGDWADYHDLGECYSGMGWVVNRVPLYPKLEDIASGARTDSALSCTRLDMHRLSGEQSVGLFSSMDRFGHIVLPQTYLGNDTAIYIQEKIVNQLREAIGLGKNPLLRETTFSPPVSTIQMMYTPKTTVSETEREELQALFVQIRSLLKNHSRFGGKSEGNPE